VSQLATVRRRHVDNIWPVAALTASGSELHSTPQLGVGGAGFRRNIVMTFAMEKLERCGYLTVKKV